MHTVEPLVVSTTSIQDYRRCKKKYELAWIRNRDVPSNEAANLGTEFHEIMHAVARQDRAWLDEHRDDEMYPIAEAYLRAKGFPSHERILAHEDPAYTLVLDEHTRHGTTPENTFTLPAVYIRTTFDLVYRNADGWIIGRDYKTFDRAPTLDVDLDFQGRMYLAALQQQYRTTNVQFEYEYVRRELGRNLSGGKGQEKVWTEWAPEERYIRVPLLVPAHEIVTLWTELRQDCHDLRWALTDDGRVWTRTDLKVGPHSCNSCFYRDLCKAELQQGGLTDDTLDFHSVARNPADRMTAKGVLHDPRVLFHMSQGAFHEQAVSRVYGESGVTLLQLEAVP